MFAYFTSDESFVMKGSVSLVNADVVRPDGLAIPNDGLSMGLGTEWERFVLEVAQAGGGAVVVRLGGDRRCAQQSSLSLSFFLSLSLSFPLFFVLFVSFRFR